MTFQKYTIDFVTLHIAAALFLLSFMNNIILKTSNKLRNVYFIAESGVIHIPATNAIKTARKFTNN